MATRPSVQPSPAPSTRLMSIWTLHLGFRLAFQIARARRLPADCPSASVANSMPPPAPPSSPRSSDPLRQSSPPIPRPSTRSHIPHSPLCAPFSQNKPCSSSSPSVFPGSNSLFSRIDSRTIMSRRHRLRCRRGGGGRGDGGRSSRPPLAIHDFSNCPPSNNNIAQFHFCRDIAKPRITATISVSFHEEPQDGEASDSRKRRNSTIPVQHPQETRKMAALPVKQGTTSSNGEGASSSGSAHGKQRLNSDSNAYSASEISSQHSKGATKDLEDYSCPIVEENPPPPTNS